MRYSQKLKKPLVLFLAAAMILHCSPRSFAAQRKLIVVLMSRALPAYEEAYKGFREEVKKVPHKTVFIDYLLEEYLLRSEEELVKRIKGLSPALICAIGTDAAIFAKERIDGLPIVFAMVLAPEDLDISNEEEITGSGLQIPVELQFEQIKNALPSIEAIGMLYDGRKKGVLLREAQDAAESLSLQLVAVPVYNMGEISTKLDEISPRVDCLWGGLDTFIYNPTTGRRIILETLKNKVPFVSFSGHFVKAGALMALECDYYDVGRQAGESAAEVLKGRSPQGIPLSVPRKTKVLINKRTAVQIGAKINEQVLQKAEIF